MLSEINLFMVCLQRFPLQAAFARACVLLVVILLSVPPLSAAAESDELETALSLAIMLRAGRAVIGSSQTLINDPASADKGLTGEVVLARTLDEYVELSGGEPPDLDPQTRRGRLLKAQTEAIQQVIDANQAAINQPGVEFKGFVPAVFARLVNERFAELVGEEATVKVTAPPALVRNRKARPDRWEAEVIEDRLMQESWPRGEVYQADTDSAGRAAFRLLVPEYYGEGCLTCHGGPAGDIDITGYPKEGGELGDLGGVISITLFR